MRLGTNSLFWNVIVCFVNCHVFNLLSTEFVRVKPFAWKLLVTLLIRRLSFCFFKYRFQLEAHQTKFLCHKSSSLNLRWTFHVYLWPIRLSSWEEICDKIIMKAVFEFLNTAIDLLVMLFPDRLDPSDKCSAVDILNAAKLHTINTKSRSRQQMLYPEEQPWTDITLETKKPFSSLFNANDEQLTLTWEHRLRDLWSSRYRNGSLERGRVASNAMKTFSLEPHRQPQRAVQKSRFPEHQRWRWTLVKMV